MTPYRRSVDCERARRQAALAPDGELSELELGSLASHLAMCAPCSTFAANVERTTLLLREAGVEAPSQPVAVRRLSSRRALVARSRPVVGAAAVALMAVGVATRAPLPVEERTPVLRATVPAASEDQAEMLSLRERTVVLPYDPAVMQPAFVPNPYPI